MGSNWPSSKSDVVDVNEPTSRSSSCLNSSSDISLILRRTITSTSICACGSPKPTIKKLDPGLKTMRRALFFRAQYLEQVVYDLARMAGRFKPGRTLLLGQFS